MGSASWSSNWDKDVVTLKQSGSEVVASGQGFSAEKGKVSGKKVNLFRLTGTVSDDQNTIAWSNGCIYTRQQALVSKQVSKAATQPAQPKTATQPAQPAAPAAVWRRLESKS